MMIYAPRNEIDLRNILYTSSLGLNHPIAIRYPRGKGEIIDWEQPFSKLEIGKIITLKKGTKIAVLSTGTIGNSVSKAIDSHARMEDFSHFHVGWVKPLDEEKLTSIFKKHTIIITVEEGVINGGLGSSINTFASRNNFKNNIINRGVSDVFIEHGTVKQLLEITKLDPLSLTQLFSEINHD
jgi:1-deoxy-D-xylulose-5-phosphate synthase